MQLIKYIALVAVLVTTSLVAGQQQTEGLVLVGNANMGDFSVSFHGSVVGGRVAIAQMNVLQTSVELNTLWRDAPECTDGTPNVDCLDDPTDAPFLRKQTVGFVFQGAQLEKAGDNSTLLGELSGDMTTFIADYLLAGRPQPATVSSNGTRFEDDGETPAYRMKARMQVRLRGLPSEEELTRLLKESSTGYVGVHNAMMTLSASSILDEREVATGLLPFSLAVDALRLDASIPTEDLSRATGLVIAPIFKWRIWKNIKVQPVGLTAPLKKTCLEWQFNLFPTPPTCKKWLWLADPTRTGPAGLAFGQPNANTLWAQVGVKFQWLPIVYKVHPELKVLDTDAERATLASLHADATAVEVYFAHQFVPESTFGGGYCSGCGGANTYVISTESMVAANIDKTHLAHELGHTMGLSHPGSGANSSTGTLMCPSGFQRDNPRRNSRENGLNVNNPLFTFFLGLSFTEPDCQDSASCGACFGVCLQNGVEVKC
jgi:hypothetical protein